MSNVFQSKRALRIFGICALAVSFVAVILRLIGIIFFFDKDIGYFKNGSIVPVLLGIILALAAIAAFVFCFIPGIKITPVKPSASVSTMRFAVFPAVGFAYYSIMYGVNLIDYIKLYGNAPLTYYFTLICSVLACAFFLIGAFGKNKSTPIYVLGGALAIVWTVIALAECYFDTFVQMNSPNKIIFQFAALSAMLLTVNEMRIGLNERKPSFHLFSSAMAVIFLAVSAIPSTICYYAKIMPVTYTLLYSDFVFLMLFVFAVARLIQLCFGKDVPEEIEVAEQAEDISTATETDEQPEQSEVQNVQQNLTEEIITDNDGDSSVSTDTESEGE